MSELEAECVRRIAEAKGVPAESLSLSTDLGEAGVDSLDRVSLSFDLEEQYGIEIPEHKLQGIRTIGDVADAVRDALAQKQAAAEKSNGAA